MKDACQVTPSEYEILEILWSRGEDQSVADVLAVLQERRELAYTTVMTLLDKLAKKGTLSRNKIGKAYYYRPQVKQDQVLSRVIDDFSSAYFGGEKSELRKFLENGQREKRPRALPEETMDIALL